MIGYVTLGTNDFEKAVAFYDALLGEMGAKRGLQTERMIIWSTGKGAALGITKPYDQKQACVGNGTMVAIAVDSREKVDALYRKAMELGAADEGPPGERFKGFYAAYFRDLDGNKVNFFIMG